MLSGSGLCSSVWSVWLGLSNSRETIHGVRGGMLTSTANKTLSWTTSRVWHQILLLHQLPSISKILKNGLNGYGDLRSIAYRRGQQEGRLEVQQINTMTYWIVDEASDIFRSFTFAEGQGKKYDKLKEKFDPHFITKRNVIFERVKFNLLKQEPKEPVDACITDLFC